MAKPSHKPIHKKDKLKPRTTTLTKSKSQHSSIPLQIEDDIPDFPRGGGSLLSRREEDEVRAQVDAEFEQELGVNKKGKRRKKTEEDDFGSLFGEGLTGKLPKFANKITFKNVSSGMKMWGVISEVNEKDLVINLPGGLRGLIRANEASDFFAENDIKDSEHNFLSGIFEVGQLVSCIVVQVDDDTSDRKGKRKIWLSLRLALLHKSLTFDAIQEGMVLTTYVKSIEDHGYILSFGPSSFSGFLPQKDKDGHEMKAKAGQLLQGVVKNIDKARRVVHMSSDTDVISKCVTKDIKGISIDLLVPGMMVNARVQSTLENGILLSFLTYFTGTVDICHLQNVYPSSKWKEQYDQNKKVNARILFIDPSTRAVGLTMNPSLVHNKAPPSHVKAGEIYDRCRVVRVDRGMGLLLEIPSTPVSIPGYVSIYDVSEEEVPKLEKKFKEGNHVRVRILGFRHLEGLATGTLKASAFEGSLFTHSDVKPGMVVKGKIVSVETFGAIVQFLGGVKALCPLPHMSEFDIAKPRKKFKVGAELVFRVLGCKSKRITVTHKKTLLKSKLKVLSSYADATDGLLTHGWITKIEKHGCFVRFYNGVQGFAPRSELGLEPGVEPSSMYHVGQVVKCRVVSAFPATRRINLSFIVSPTRGSSEDVVKVGAVVSGVVERVTPKAVIVQVSGYVKGTIVTEHLADHQGQATQMKSILKPGYEFDQLLVLDFDGNNLVLSAKYSLINSASDLPVDVAQFHPDLVTHGYICNIIESGCFVRFLGRVTAFAPKHKAIDDQRTDISEAFYNGQSVRGHVLNVDSETGRITLSLKQSSCFSTNASLIQAFFLVEEKIANLQSDPEKSDCKWLENFSIGSIVEGKVDEAKEFGVVLSFKNHNNVFGFVSHYQLGGTNVETGSVVQAMVLDVANAERLVDLSLKPELISKSKEDKPNSSTKKKKRKRDLVLDLEVHQTVNAIIEIVKENYLVLSLPQFNHAIGYASIADYNTQKLPHRHLVNGQSVVATVGALPGPSSGGRLLLLLNSLSEVKETSSSKKAKKKSAYSVGSLVEAEITDIKPFEIQLKFGQGFRGRLHITEVDEDHDAEGPFKKFRIGQMLTARIVEKIDQSKQNRKQQQWELSVRSAVLSGSEEIQDVLTTKEVDFSSGKMVSGYVVSIDNDWVWVTISRHVKAQLYILDSSCEPSELLEFQKRFSVGNLITGYILSFNKEKRILRLISRPQSIASHMVNNDENAAAHHIHEGDILGGRITKILPGVGGLLVQIGPHLHGRVHFTELTDKWVADPLSQYEEGQFIKCKVLEVSRSVHGMRFDLSSRTEGLQNDRYEKLEDLQQNMIVQGYVKNVMSKGCFIMLSRKVDAKVLLSNLSNSFIKNPEEEFPVGMLVQGKVLSVEPMSKRVEVTLKTEATGEASKFDKRDFTSLHVGEVISGRIKRIEAFGLFITIDQTNMVGLCHISELSDSQVENIESKYRVGEKVVAKILKVEEERHRISLGMKESYMLDNINDPKHSDQNIEESSDADSDIDDPDTTMLQASNLSNCITQEEDNHDYSVLTNVESRASIPPLEVTLDDIDDDLDFDNFENKEKESLEDVEITTEKSKRREKKKEMERELEIRAAEQRLLVSDIPRTADEFEKLVRSSPNSSFVWIQYMAFLLSLADPEKARSVAERALQTINIREEGEKLNVWLAYFNLENEYGNPKEEAVNKIFQRALQYCDQKKVYFALLGMYERTEQYKLADQLLVKMTKKFKQSRKVWLRRIQSALREGKTEIKSIVASATFEGAIPKRKHIMFLTQAAVLEFKMGDPDRGRGMFEDMLRNYGKRIDLWSVYLDQEIRMGDVDVTRGLFERAISISVSSKKMKPLFKKYMKYEEEFGDEERVEYVKRRALEYIEST
ncbi:hypothetical protein ACHQM5_012960 [Ranunculus cassubicifolius]